MDTPAGDLPLKPAGAPRKRPRPGERRQQILQCLAGMLESGGAERITTAALAQRLQVSEAALYRHFASKAQMFEALIAFVETSIFGLINQISEQHESGLLQALRIVQSLLVFAERNPGLSRVLNGAALVGEHERLQQRVDQLFLRIEAALRQSLRLAQEQGGLVEGCEPTQRAQWLLTYARGWLHQLAQPGAKPSAQPELALQLLLS